MLDNNNSTTLYFFLQRCEMFYYSQKFSTTLQYALFITITVENINIE